MADPDWYAGWRTEAVHALRQKNDALTGRFNMGNWPRYDYDVNSRQLIFLEGGVAKVIADIQLVGSTSDAAGTWTWGWANPAWPSACTQDAARARAFGQEHAIAQLTTATVDDREFLEALGWELTAVAARLCDAIGAYRPPHDQGGGVFMIYRDIRWAD